MRIIVTGSRTWREPERIWEALDYCVTRGKLILAHGGCPEGADLYAHLWYLRNQFQDGNPVTEEVHNADWKVFGKSAGRIRNREMVEAGANLVLAFIDKCKKLECSTKHEHPTHGTANCMEEAELANIPVIKFWAF